MLFAIGSRVVVSLSLVGGERMRLTSRRKISKLLAREDVGYMYVYTEGADGFVGVGTAGYVCLVYLAS